MNIKEQETAMHKGRPTLFLKTVIRAGDQEIKNYSVRVTLLKDSGLFWNWKCVKNIAAQKRRSAEMKAPDNLAFHFYTSMTNASGNRALIATI